MIVILPTASINAMTAALNYRRGRKGYKCPPKVQEKNKNEVPSYHFEYPTSRYWREICSKNYIIDEKTKDNDSLLTQGIRRETESFSNGDEFYSYSSYGFKLYHIESKDGKEYEQLRYEYSDSSDTVGNCGSYDVSGSVFMKEYYPDGKLKFVATPTVYKEYDKNGNILKGEFYSYYPDSGKVESLSVYENGKKVEVTSYDLEANKTEFHRYNDQGTEIEFHRYDKQGKEIEFHHYDDAGKELEAFCYETKGKETEFRRYADGKEVEYRHYDKKGQEDTEIYLKKQQRREKANAFLQNIKSVFSKSR